MQKIEIFEKKYCFFPLIFPLAVQLYMQNLKTLTYYEIFFQILDAAVSNVDNGGGYLRAIR